MMIISIIFQGQLSEAEYMFSEMKMNDCCPDAIAYTTMIHAYDSAGYLVYIFSDKLGKNKLSD